MRLKVEKSNERREYTSDVREEWKQRYLYKQVSVSRKLKKMFALLNRIQLQDPDEDDDEDRCSIVVSLMRIDRKRTPATEKPPIGFAIYKVKTHSRKIGFLKYGLLIF